VSGNSANYGGAIYNNALSFGSAILSVVNSRLIGNSANFGGGIYNDARSNGTTPIAISGSTFSSNSVVVDFDIGGGEGGGIYNDAENGANGTLSISSSTFDGNSAQNGGALDNNSYQGTGRFYVSNCTFSRNFATSGGAISSSGFQGLAQLVVSACTFSDNSAGGFGTIFNANGNLQLADSILSSAASETNVVNSGGSASSSGYNLFSDDASGVFTNATDRLNTNPLLGPLQDNGGQTFTHALLAGSPAIDQGKHDAVALLPVTADQRGVARPVDFPAITNAAGGDGSDIGAVEFNQPTLAIQKVETNVVLSWESFLGAFTLETSTNLGTTNGWSAVAGSPSLNGNQYQQTNGPIAGTQFFRLRGN
jgi:predicted outer membrane repeat protein